MTFTPEQVETIVLEVIRRLGLLETNSTRERGTETNPTRERGSDELTLKDKVVTMRLVEGRLSGVTRLFVNAKAIVTPAVKDELKQYKVELVRQG
jgi:hypothetical protein